MPNPPDSTEKHFAVSIIFSGPDAEQLAELYQQRVFQAMVKGDALIPSPYSFVISMNGNSDVSEVATSDVTEEINADPEGGDDAEEDDGDDDGDDDDGDPAVPVARPLTPV